MPLFERVLEVCREDFGRIVVVGDQTGRFAGYGFYLLKGKPVPPKYQWTTTGLNFLGFPTVPVNPPFFESFLSRAPALLQNAEIYQYVGGELGATEFGAANGCGRHPDGQALDH